MRRYRFQCLELGGERVSSHQASAWRFPRTGPSEPGAIRAILSALILPIFSAESSRADVVTCQRQEIRRALLDNASRHEWEMAVHWGMTVYVRKLHAATEEAATVRKCMIGFDIVICDDNNEYVEEPMKARVIR
jgi:hypothetical protein